MLFSKRKAFTLTELLVVVIVLGVLAAVAVPKFARVLETRKTSEAEEIFGAVRSEQEYRCSLGKVYQTDKSQMAMLSGISSPNYNYQLTGQGITASSDKGYTLKMLSYKDGRTCCEGSYCDSLNKDYPKCEDMPVIEDECANDEVVIEPEPEPEPEGAAPPLKNRQPARPAETVARKPVLLAATPKRDRGLQDLGALARGKACAARVQANLKNVLVI